jgi:hypothetical protein
MQPKPLHRAAAGSRLLNANAAAATVWRHAGIPIASLAGESDPIRRPDRTIHVDLYRRRIAAGRRQPRESAALACVGVLVMSAIYLALFFAAARARTSNHTQPAAPISALPIPNAADVRF